MLFNVVSVLIIMKLVMVVSSSGCCGRCWVSVVIGSVVIIEFSVYMFISWLIVVLFMFRFLFIGCSIFVGRVLVNRVMKLLLVKVSRFVYGRCVVLLVGLVVLMVWLFIVLFLGWYKLYCVVY